MSGKVRTRIKTDERMTQIIFCYFSNHKKIGEISEILLIRVLIFWVDLETKPLRNCEDIFIFC